MPFVEIIATIAILQFLLFGALTGRERGRSGLKAPAMTGDAGFERMYRVQMNTLELLVAFLPALFLAALHWSPMLVGAPGIVYLLGRHLYWRAYIKDPGQRGLGFMLSIIPIGILAALALTGSVIALAS